MRIQRFRTRCAARLCSRLRRLAGLLEVNHVIEFERAGQILQRQFIKDILASLYELLVQFRDRRLGRQLRLVGILGSRRRIEDGSS